MKTARQLANEIVAELAEAESDFAVTVAGHACAVEMVEKILETELKERDEEWQEKVSEAAQ